MSVPFTNLPRSATVQPTPFKVSIPQSNLDELKTLIQLSKVAPLTYEGSQEDRKYGVTNKWIREAKEKWEKDFDWRKHEAHINSFPHYIAPVVDDDGKEYKIHFVALFSDKSDAVPLVLLHGWPGSFIEFLPMLTLLSDGHTPSTLPYHLIVPSLPGYTFSSNPPLDKDFRIEDIARIINRLVIGLGFEQGYVVQGGDIGSKVARVMAAEHASCKVNFCIMPEPSGVDNTTLNELDREGLRRAAEFMSTGSAYALEHATRTSTIGHVLASNPIALLAWIGEKFLEWTDEDLPLDTILESVTLYWVTETLPRALYPYRQLLTPGNIGAHENPKWYIKKPFGFSWFPKEITPVPQSWAATTGNLVFFRQHTKGGHFAALERPDVLAKDIKDFIEQVWPQAQKA
ncbi:unnamed protein product [Adineta steineri]|uniref:Epoxide hydrolase n=2 Tax=Adineta steineri TaxID=433720 RepID=A0A819N9M2_9BILA|nr:unnamed protein product [Adineta steineri]